MGQNGPRLEGKVALVTGAGSSGPGFGTGKAMAVLFAREGARVLLVDQVAERAEETLTMIRDEGGEAATFQANVSSGDGCRGMVEAATAQFGGLDILVNNVGIAGWGTAVEVSEETWDRTMDVNLKSMMLAGKHAIPTMIEGGGGAIVNISSLAAWRASPPGALVYTVSKIGVVGLTMSMALAHAREGVRVNCILPGQINTPMAAVNLDLSDEAMAARAQMTPLGTPGTAWDIAWAALFLASDEARWITGVALPVDAGTLCISGVYQP